MVSDGYSFNQPPLSDLLKRCEILDSDYHSDPTAVERLATLVTEGKLTNGLYTPMYFWPSCIARSIESLLHQHQDMNILLVNQSFEPLSFEQNHRLLQISLGFEPILRAIPEGKPGHHIKIFLDHNWTQLTKDDHVSIFRSIVTPVAEEFKPDMVFFVLDVLSPWSCLISCVGRLTGMLMKLADGKVIVCNEYSPPDITEVLLHTLLSDNNDTLLGPYHPTAEGSKIIEKTVKKYGEHWKCLREVCSPARVTKDKYYALKKTEEEFATTSKTVAQQSSRRFSGRMSSLPFSTLRQEPDSEVVAGTSEKAQGSDNQTALDKNKQEQFNPETTDLSEPDKEDENCNISAEESTNSKHIALMSSSPTNPDVGSSHPGKEFHVSAGSESLEGPSAHSKVDRHMRDLHSMEEVVPADDDRREKSQDQMNVSLPSTSHERIADKQEDVKPHDQKSRKHFDWEEPEEMDDLTVGLESSESPSTPVPAKKQKGDSAEEAADDGGEKSQDQMNQDVPSTSHERIADKQEDVKLHDQKFRRHLFLEELEELVNLTVEKEVGPSGDTIKLHSYEITFPAGAVDENIKTRFRLSFLDENLCLPNNLIPIAHPIFCSPGKTVFKQDVIMKIPVWFKVTDTSSSAKPTYVHLYTRNQAGMWEVVDSVQLGTSETITFKCKHFCPIIPCVEQADVDDGEFTLDYFLSMDDDENFASCHCVSSDALVETMEKRMKKCGFTVIHPATTRQSVKPNTRIPISLTSRQPQMYEFESDGNNILFIDDKFYRLKKCEDFRFILAYHSTDDVKKIRFTYKVGEKSRLIQRPTGKRPEDGLDSKHGHLEGSKNGSPILFNLSSQVHVGDKVGGINANAITTRSGLVEQDQSNCRNIAFSNKENRAQPVPQTKEDSGQETANGHIKKMNEVLYEVADKVEERDWPRFVRTKLDLSEHEIDNIQTDITYNTEEKKFQMLKKWAKKRSESDQEQKEILIRLMKDFLGSAT